MKNNDDLISACIVWEEPNITDPFSKLINLFNQLSEGFEFFEILLLIKENDFKEYSNAFSDIDKLRFIILRTPSNHYEKRTICAKESIGDIVVISTINEIEFFNFQRLVNLSLDNDCIVITKAEKMSLVEKIFSYPFLFLGNIVGLEINFGLSRTIVLPRTLLNLILSQEYEDLKLRFPPSNLDFKIRSANPTKRIKRGYSDIRSKFSLIYKLLLNLTPVLLKQLTIFSGMGAVISFLYMLYSLGIYIFMTDIQSGWFTLSLSISGTALFLTLSIFILSIGIQHMLFNFNENSKKSFLYEVDSIDLYKNVKNDLNIELNQSNDKSNK